METLLMSLKRISAAILSIVFIHRAWWSNPDMPIPGSPFSDSAAFEVRLKFTAVQIPGTRSRVRLLLTISSQPAALNY